METEASPPTEVLKEPEKYRVVIVGLTGGGRDLTFLRQSLEKEYGENNTRVLSSISTPEAHKKEERPFSPKTHYQQEAQTIAQEAQGKDLTIIGQSMGLFEVLDLTDELLDLSSWQGKKIELVFFATPGLGIKRLSGWLEGARGVANLARSLAYYDQHYLYPTSEKFYEGKEIKTPQGISLIPDSAEEREERRKKFLRETLPKLISQEEQTRIVNKLAEIDQEVADKTNPQNKENLLRERAEILRPVIDALARGDHISEDLHREYLEKYQEIASDLSKPVVYWANTLLYLAKKGIDLFEGIDTRFKKVLEKAKAKNKQLNLNLILVEGESTMDFRDVSAFTGRLEEADAREVLKTIMFMENAGHTNIGYTDVVSRFLKYLN